MANVKQIETFYWTLKLGTLQGAADKLFITQSAATKRVRELEKQCAHPLFEKNAQKSSLTPKGEELLLAAEAVLESLKGLEDLRSSARRTMRTIRIGITELIALTWFSRFVEHLNSVYPNVSLFPDVDLSARLQQKMLTGELDLIVVPSDYVTGEMESVLVDSVEFSWLAPPGSFSECMPLPLNSLAKLPVIVQGPLSGITTRCQHLFAQAGIAYQTVYGSNSLFALAALIRAGVGASCIPRGLFQKQIENGLFQEVILETGNDRVDYHLAFLKHDHGALGYLLGNLARQCADSTAIRPPIP
ncbi:MULTISPECIES: LysR family transcriptional regulator [unclassified Pseudomonas]|uniref:LysR family transcriptional regulator n=1 Tax=unclassified Pseudomonas TaxID=196821 RepID=UPI0030DBAA70